MTIGYRSNALRSSFQNINNLRPEVLKHTPTLRFRTAKFPLKALQYNILVLFAYSRFEVFLGTLYKDGLDIMRIPGILEPMLLKRNSRLPKSYLQKDHSQGVDIMDLLERPLWLALPFRMAVDVSGSIDIDKTRGKVVFWAGELKSKDPGLRIVDSVLDIDWGDVFGGYSGEEEYIFAAKGFVDL